MPELPEVETVVRGLNQVLPGQKIKNIESLHKKSLLALNSLPVCSVHGLEVEELSRRGKGIIINLSKSLSLLIHLKMTGQLIYVDKTSRLNFGHPDPNFIASMPSKHTRVIIQLSKGTLYFNDQRLFGWVKILPTLEVPNDPFIRKLGPEPLTKDFTAQLLEKIISRRPKSSIKAIILDQAAVVGVGNIYADEALFKAKIRPTRLGKDIKKLEVSTLTKAIKEVLTLGIKHRGTSMSHYKTAEGSVGKMQNHLNVYGRGNKPCPICGNPINKIRAAGRGTHYCPVCQE